MAAPYKPNRAQLIEGARYLLSICRNDAGRPQGQEALELHFNQLGYECDAYAHWSLFVKAAQRKEPALREHEEGVYLPARV